MRPAGQQWGCTGLGRQALSPEQGAVLLGVFLLLLNSFGARLGQQSFRAVWFAHCPSGSLGSQCQELLFGKMWGQ